MLENMQNTQNMKICKIQEYAENAKHFIYWLKQSMLGSVFIQNLQKAKGPVGYVHCAPSKNGRYIEDLASPWKQEWMNIFILHSPTGAKKSLLLAPGLS